MFAFQQSLWASVFSPVPRALPPPSTLTPNQTMAGRISDRELKALARTIKTPALQAKDELENCSQICLVNSAINLALFFFSMA